MTKSMLLLCTYADSEPTVENIEAVLSECKLRRENHTLHSTTLDKLEAMYILKLQQTKRKT